MTSDQKSPTIHGGQVYMTGEYERHGRFGASGRLWAAMFSHLNLPQNILHSAWAAGGPGHGSDWCEIAPHRAVPPARPSERLVKAAVSAAPYGCRHRLLANLGFVLLDDGGDVLTQATNALRDP